MIDHSNFIEVVGILDKDPMPSVVTSRVAFLSSTVSVLRHSGTVDVLPVIIPNDVMNSCVTDGSMAGRLFRIRGEIRSHDEFDGGKMRHKVYIRVEHMAEEQWVSDINRVHLIGTICKTPVYRVTPLGREICDFMISINNPRGARSYIPCITWGYAAQMIGGWNAGDKVDLIGRFQSREYQKVHPDGRVEIRTAYEVSARKIRMSGGDSNDS